MEYQIEMLRKHGLQNPFSGMDKKVKRVQFSQVIEIRDPVTKELDRKDAKNFMVNQTSILLDRDQILLSPFDDMVWKQMMDYQVVRISQNGKPVYTSENEHALDAFMLCILGFTLEFPNITKILEEIHFAKRAIAIDSKITDKLQEKAFGDTLDVYSRQKRKPEREAKDNPNWYLEKVPIGYTRKKSAGWGKRGSSLANAGLSRSRF